MIISIFSGSIGISMKFSLDTIQTYIHEPLPSPAELEQLFTFHLCEVEGLEACPDGDTLIDLNILPNRAHDMLGHYGVAREIAGQLGLTLKPLLMGIDGPLLELVSLASSDFRNNAVAVSIDTDACSRYMARRIDGVAVRPSSDDVRSFLAKFGQRSINNLVDATNQIMLVTGQPTHVFDADKVTGGIIVRMAHAGESVILLDGKEIVLDESIMVIADDVAVLAIAGVKGGKHAEVDSNTTNIILEVANFDASTIRKTAQKLGLRTDASYRFERDISPSLCGGAIVKLTGHIIASLNGNAQEGMVVDIYPQPQVSAIIDFSLRDISAVAGCSVNNPDVTNILQRYGFSYVEREDNFSVTVPLWRLDLAGRHDMIEEIIRIRGLERVEPIAPPVLPLQENRIQELTQYIRHFLISAGFSEVMTYSFRDSGESRVLASAGDKSYLRSNLMTGFAESLQKNAANRDMLGFDEVCQFEIGTVFSHDTEQVHLCIGARGGKKTRSMVVVWQDLFLALGIDGSAQTTLMDAAQPIAVNSVDNCIEINIEKFADRVKFSPKTENVTGPSMKVKPFTEWSKYPYITRDIAVWTVEGSDPEMLQKIYSDAAGELLVRPPRLVDQFTKDSRTSYAFRLVFQSYDHTLADAEVEPLMAAVTNAAVEQGWEVR